MTFEDFQASKTEMTAQAYGDLIGDASWPEREELNVVLVYGGHYNIEHLRDGRHQLVIENRCWITDSETTLADLEYELFLYAKSDWEAKARA